MDHRFHNNRGVSLLEVMCAIIILSIAVVALYYMFNQGQVLLMEQAHRRLAFEKAQRRMAIFKLLKDQDPTAIPYGTTSGSDFLVDPDEQNESPGLAADYELTVIDSTKYMFVKLEYSWRERSGRQYGFVVEDCF